MNAMDDFTVRTMALVPLWGTPFERSIHIENEDSPMLTSRTNLFCDSLAIAAALSALLGWSSPALAGPPTTITVTNQSADPVFANLVLGQPPTELPTGCTSLGQQIQYIRDPRLMFTSSITGKQVRFLPQNRGIRTKGYYLLEAGETITYHPHTFACPTGKCSPGVSFNFFFTAHRYNGEPDNGCAHNKFPNATNLAEASVNFGINGAVGAGCPNADSADISAVNGINAALALNLKGASWPLRTASNRFFGHNADRPGVYGWGATNCINNSGYPNPGKKCAAPSDAPRVPKDAIGCTTPIGEHYDAIYDPVTKVAYCDERSDPEPLAPEGFCLIQRPAAVTGGAASIIFKNFYE